MGGNWRPVFNSKVIHRELGIIKNELHCNAVRICGLDIGRLMTAAEDALKQGLEVWLSPEMWDKGAGKTLAYITRAAAAADKLRGKYSEQFVFLVGSELTLFMQGIVPGRNVIERMGSPSSREILKAGKHNAPLNAWLTQANRAVREVFHGQVTYASLVWEAADWQLFDLVWVDHYWVARIKDQYLEMLKPAFSQGKPVVITEFAFRTYNGADSSTEGLAGDLIDCTPNPWVMVKYLINLVGSSLFGMQLPPPRMRLKKGNCVRDEESQASALIDQLRTLDSAGVEGTFIMTFASPTAPYNDNPGLDLDMNSYSLVKSHERDRRGATYPDLPWEPKKSFHAVAEFYGRK
jgi:hypothetical protein